MCDLFSWIDDNGKIYYLTDDMVEAKSQDLNEPICWHDWVGHTGIKNYFGFVKLSKGFHKESIHTIPPVMVDDVNSGKMRNIMKAYSQRISSLKYDKEGNLIEVNGRNIRSEGMTKGALEYMEKDYKEPTVIVLKQHYYTSGWNPLDTNMVQFFGFLKSKKAFTIHKKSKKRFRLPLNWGSMMYKFTDKLYYLTPNYCRFYDTHHCNSININDYYWHLGATRKATKKEIQTLEWVNSSNKEKYERDMKEAINV